MTAASGRRPPAPRAEVAVTGLGASTPLGGDVESTWKALLAGESGIAALDEEWAASLQVRIAGRLRVEPAQQLSRVEARRHDRNQQTALVAAREAWAHAGRPGVEPERLAVVIGTGIGGLRTTLHQAERLERRGPASLTPFAVPMLMPNGAAAAVSLDLGARGGAHTPVSACASGAEAIALGLSLILAGSVDVVVAGGTEACLHAVSIAGFAQMQALSTRNDDPPTACRPFDRSRDGFVLAEGAGVLILERAGFARARGARTHACLAGAGITSDAHNMTNPDPAGQVRAITAALAMAGLAPQDVQHVNAHATGTRGGDLMEAVAIAQAVGTHPSVTATKGATGHLIGATGGVEAITTVLTLRDGTVPATRNLTEQDRDIPLDVVAGAPRSQAATCAVSNSFGFGGHNVALAFTRC